MQYKMNPKVSVIVPNYNHSKYLEQRIDSVLNQTYQDLELIILDDKSSDNSKEIIEQYRTHPKVSNIVYNEVNSGTTFKQWNRGVQIATGELIWIAESDDDASPYFLENLVAKFEEDPTLGIVYCNSYTINEKGEQLKKTQEWKNRVFASSRWSTDYRNRGVDELNDYLIFHTVIDNVSSALIKKQVFVDAGLADESFRYAGDTFFYMKALLISDVYYISKPLNYFRDHPVNTSKAAFTNGARPLEELLAYTKIIYKNSKISKATRRKRKAQAIANYKSFAGIMLRTNKDYTGFIKGNIQLLKANPGFFSTLFTGYIFSKL